jgi:hypothetical protein
VSGVIYSTVVVNGSLDLAAQAARLQAFLFDLATMGTARGGCAVASKSDQRRARSKARSGGRTLRLFHVTSRILFLFPSVGASIALKF